MSDNYTMVGIVNVFGVVPDFVLPVFKKSSSDGLYVQMGDNGRVTGMIEIGDDLAQRVYFFDEKILFEHVEIPFWKYSPIYCFQTGFGIFVGDGKDMFEFFEGYHTNSDRVKEEIREFKRYNIIGWRSYMVSRKKREITSSSDADHKGKRNKWRRKEFISPTLNSIVFNMYQKNGKEKQFVFMYANSQDGSLNITKRARACKTLKSSHFKKN